MAHFEKPLQMSTAQEEAMLAELKAQVEKVRVACCLAAVLIPVCFFFYVWGVCRHRWRWKSLPPINGHS